MLSGGSKAASRISRGRIPAKSFCFVAGTLVITAAGAVPIEAVALGDMVLSRDSATGEQALRPVTELYRNQASELIHVDVAGETITATPAHPFWVDGIGWVDAGALSAGNELVLADGGSATVVSVVREHLQSPRDVYNFEVADFHTYFVASAGVWVHNACAAKVVGQTRSQHRYHANKQLLSRLTSDAKFRQRMTREHGKAVAEFIANKGKRNLAGTQWHHRSMDVMQVMTRAQHKAHHLKHGRDGAFKLGKKIGRFR